MKKLDPRSLCIRPWSVTRSPTQSGATQKLSVGSALSGAGSQFPAMLHAVSLRIRSRLQFTRSSSSMGTAIFMLLGIFISSYFCAMWLPPQGCSDSAAVVASLKKQNTLSLREDYLALVGWNFNTVWLFGSYHSGISVLHRG